MEGKGNFDSESNCAYALSTKIMLSNIRCIAKHTFQVLANVNLIKV